MNVLTTEFAAIAQAASQADARGDVARLEAQAKAQGFMDEQGYWTQSDDDFLADLGVAADVDELPLAA